MAGDPGGIKESVRRQIAEGRALEEIVETLVAGGLSKPSAERFVERAMAEPPAQGEPLKFEAFLEGPKASSAAWWRAVLLLFGFFAFTLPVYLCATGMRQARRVSNEEMLKQIEADMNGEPQRPQQIKQEHVDAALEKLRSGEEWERCEAAMMLARSKNQTAVQPLVEVVRRADTKEGSQYCIVNALAQLGESDVALGYYNAWLDSDNPARWREAVIGIGSLGANATAGAARALERAMQSEQADLRALAVQSATKIGAESVLQAATEDENPTVRSEARNGLRAIQQ
jgi:hypothetical protein